MSLKAELETWAAALKSYEEEDFEKTLELFSTIGDSSKILTNMGLIYATLGEHEAAVEQFIAATQLDQYLSVAYFQCGVSNFLLTRYELALKDFEEALLYLRGNESINYEQLGLKFKLYSAEVLFNKGLSHIYMGNTQQGLKDMEEARSQKQTEEHNVIDDAIQDRGDGYTVFSIPVGILYRPPESKLKNAKTKDYLGKAKLVATSDANETFTTFTGVTRLKQGVAPSGAFVDGNSGAEGLTRAATVSVTSRPAVVDEDTPKPLQRAKTTISVPSDTRERVRAADVGSSPTAASPSAPSPPAASAMGRSNTTVGRMGGPVRGLSVRRPGAPSLPGANMGGPGGGSRPSPTGRSPTSGGQGQRLTEFYDDYIDSYGDDYAQPRRTRSTYSSSGSMRRKPTRRNTRGPSRNTYYEEEEEGYGSGGDFDDDMIKIRVKLHYQDDVRGMAIDSTMPFDEFMERVTTKFGMSFEGLGLKFKDEDGGKVTLKDEMDYELAIETAREAAKGKAEGRLEIWCSET